MRLSEVVKGLNIVKIVVREGFRPPSEIEVTGLTVDSRICKKRDAFFCLTGGKSDGHAFAKSALNNGAVALVVERELELPAVQIVVSDTREATSVAAANFYGHPANKLKIVGVTGTNGKTTVSHMLAAILRADGKRVGVIGTLGIFYANKKIAPELTTPDPLFMHETFADMVKEGIEYVVMEVSAHALHYKKTQGVRFAACAFTNFSQDHLDFFKDKTAYKNAKLSLFSEEICPIAVVNGDDPVGREIVKLRSQNKEEKTLVYGLDNPSDAFAVLTHETLHGSQFMLNINDELCRVSLELTGLHNVYNALAAATCAFSIGIGMSEIKTGLSSLSVLSGRLERVGEFHGAHVFIDYAHTPDGLEKSLSCLKKHCRGKLICLFGCGGNRDRGKRPIMGEVAAKKADFSVLTSDNPRYEDPLDIISEIEIGYRRFSSSYVVVPDRKKAIGYALDFVGKGDVLLVAGKGGEDYQEIMGIKYFFNDNDIIKKTMEQKRENPYF